MADTQAKWVVNTLEITNHRHHRQGRFNEHALIPGAFRTQLEIVGYTIRFAKALIDKDNTGVAHRFYNGMEVLVMGIHRIPIPPPAHICSAASIV